MQVYEVESGDLLAPGVGEEEVFHLAVSLNAEDPTGLELVLTTADESASVFVAAGGDAGINVCGAEVLLEGHAVSGVAFADALDAGHDVHAGGALGFADEISAKEEAEGVLLAEVSDSELVAAAGAVPEEGFNLGDGAWSPDCVEVELGLESGSGTVTTGDAERASGLAFGGVVFG